MPKGYAMRIRPGNPRPGQRLIPRDMFCPEKCINITFESGIEVVFLTPNSMTVIVKNTEFCVVICKGSKFHELAVCLPNSVNGREVLFYSSTINPLTIR